MADRIEKDSLGEVRVPGDALYGAQTARAVENFPISGRGIGRELIRALGLIKYAAAVVNERRGKLPPETAQAIRTAAREVFDGKLDAHFPVDVFQTGSGTSSNMNANEVIANRALQLLGGELGSKAVHPNDHVNMGQSSNDVFPAAIHVAAMTAIEEKLLPALTRLREMLEQKSAEFDEIVKIGRTHLQDATPLRLGQEFSGYASQVAHGIDHLQETRGHLLELPLGGTAVGTGLNTSRDFGTLLAAQLTELTGLERRHGLRFVEAPNHFEAQAAQDAAVQASGALKTLAVSLIKIANDVRWLGSGPRLGLGELVLPPVQPGSSIMPGKVNPVMAEALLMVCAQVIGNDAAITLGGLSGNFELNVMLPLIGRNLLEQIELLANAVKAFTEKLLLGLRADRRRIETLREQSLALATALAPLIGYDAAAELAQEAYRTGKTIREIAREKNILPADELEKALAWRSQTEPDE